MSLNSGEGEEGKDSLSPSQKVLPPTHPSSTMV